MNSGQTEFIGHACSYTPLPMIHGAGYAPYRVLPVGEAPDRAGQILHDNLCPHVKRILDRAIQGDIPDLKGMVFMNCCDAMRRLADAWKKTRPDDEIILVDLPATVDESSISFFASELTRLQSNLAQWGGRLPDSDSIEGSIALYNSLAILMDRLQDRVHRGALEGGPARLQQLRNRAAVEPIEEFMTEMEGILQEDEPADGSDGAVPIYLFGNVLPDPEAFSLFQTCGIQLVGDDVCTGSRFLNVIDDTGEEVILRLARGILSQPRCARTFDPAAPGRIAADLVERAKASRARGVIGYTMKFCDPYIARVPNIRDTLREAGLPLLLLEGDCTMRSMGQQRTRIEAFAEMLR